MATKPLCSFLVFFCHVFIVGTLISHVYSQGTSSVSFTTYQRVPNREGLNQLLASMRAYTGETGGRRLDTEFLKSLRPDQQGIYQVPVAHYAYTVHHPPTIKRFMHSSPTRINLNANGQFQNGNGKPCKNGNSLHKSDVRESFTINDADERTGEERLVDDPINENAYADADAYTLNPDQKEEPTTSTVKNDNEKEGDNGTGTKDDLQNYSLLAAPSKERCGEGQTRVRGKCKPKFRK